MRNHNYLTAAATIVGCVIVTSAAYSQAPTTVQLPTLQVFSVNTTVSVPDGGGALLGGINRARDGSVSRGLPLASKIPGLGRLAGNRGIGLDRSSQNMSVHATIIDHQELDAAVLAQAAARRANVPFDAAALATNQKADFIARNLARAERLAPVVVAKAEPSIEEIRRQNELKAANRDAEADAYFAKGLAAEAEGKPNVAKIFYQMVARRATGSLKAEADERLLALTSPGKAAVAAK